MKATTTNRFKKINLLFSLLLTTLCLLSSCGKTDNPTSSLSLLRVVNASPSLSTYNVYLNGSIFNSVALPFVGSTTYSARNAGEYSIKFTNTSNLESLFSSKITLNTSSTYSYYLINKPGQLDGLLITDDSSNKPADKAYIRFINLSPDAPALDLFKSGTTTSYTTNKSFKTYSALITVDAGTYSLDIKDSATGSVKATISDANFVAGFRYDIICGGLVTPANDTERPLSLQVLTLK